jgi:hypothetical protein
MRIIEWIDLFLADRLTLTELWKNLGLIPSLLESSVPSQVRTAIQKCANELEIIDETKDAATGRQLAETLTSSLKDLIVEHLSSDSQQEQES